MNCPNIHIMIIAASSERRLEEGLQLRGDAQTDLEESRSRDYFERSNFVLKQRRHLQP